MASVYIGLGTNLGNREANLELAIRLFKPEFTVRKVSPVYETDPLYRLGQPQFFNAVCCVETTLSPEAALEKCKAIERAMGRKKGDTHDPRIIDVDILFYDDVVLKTADLTIPHPRLHERAYMLVPLSKIAPRFVNPATGKTVMQMLRALGRFSHKIVRIDQTV